MKEILTIVGATGLALYLWQQYQDAKRYGVPMFSEQLRQLREQDAGF